MHSPAMRGKSHSCSSCYTADVCPLLLDGEGFGEFEAEGGLGGQDNLLLPGVGRFRGSRSRTQCCADECAFATAGKTSYQGRPRRRRR